MCEVACVTNRSCNLKAVNKPEYWKDITHDGCIEPFLYTYRLKSIRYHEVGLILTIFKKLLTSINSGEAMQTIALKKPQPL